MKWVLAGLLFSFVSSVSFSKTLIVSDIDDTIKVSHVRNKFESTQNGLLTTPAFLGMKEVYEDILSYEEGSEIIYVTNALDFLMHGSHTAFVKNNKFPAGKIFFRTGSSDTHKVNTIRKYLKDNPSFNRLVLVGDNGERDIKFYDQIAREYGDHMDIHTYIRIVYAPPTETLPLAENQKGFVSPLELLADLTVSYLVPIERYYEIAEKIAAEVIKAEKVTSKNPQYFPSWLNCKNFEPGSYPGLSSPKIEEGFAKVRAICN